METTLLEKLETLEKKIDLILAKNTRDKLSPPGIFGDKLSPPLKWSETWVGGEMDLRPARSYNGFDRRYLLRSLGPTKVLERVIDTLMSFPRNQNFHLKSKRTYVHVGSDRWEEIRPKLFYEQLRKKILKHYGELVLRAQTKLIKSYAKGSLKNSIIPWTNQYLEKVFEKWGSSQR